jgi:hypothetical protein
MNLSKLAIVLVCLSACASPSADPVTAPVPASSSAARLDFTGLEGRSMSAEEFLKECQRISGCNFTYAGSTAAALSQVSLRVTDTAQVADADVARFVNAQLATCGFECAPVGPEHLRLLLMQPRAG